MEQRGPRWESEYTEFVAAYAAKLRRLAYLRCGDWAVADAALDRALRALYRRWPALGNEKPDEFADRWLREEVRRLHRGPVMVSEGALAPVATVDIATLIVTERRRRTRMRLVGSVVSIALLAAAGAGLVLLRPTPEGGLIPDLNDCMSDVPRSGLPRGSAAGTPPAGATPSGPQSGVDRLVTVADLLPFPDSPASPTHPASPASRAGSTGLTPARVERMACALAELFMARVNPSAIERIDLGLGAADPRTLWPQPDPVYGTALTTSVLLMTPSGTSTATVTVARTSFLPPTGNCARLAFCQTSNKGENGQIIEQYGVRDTPTGSAGFTLGDSAAWWAMLVYTGHTLVSLTITNTSDIRAALPASSRASPLSPQSAQFATDPRLALFDPPADPTTAS